MKNGIIFDEYYTIKDLPETERPREKLCNYGVESLSNSELIAIIIRTGYKNFTALDLANQVIRFDSSGIKYLGGISVEELQAIKGIGQCKASQIVAAVELGKRISTYKGFEEKIRVNSPEIISNLFMEEMKYFKREHFRTINLDTKNQIIGVEEISIGNLNSSIVHPREVFNVAIRKSANSIILLHNHPSGDSTPSMEDVNVTRRLIEAGNIIGIKVLDHIIIGEDRYTSFKEKNILEF